MKYVYDEEIKAREILSSQPNTQPSWYELYLLGKHFRIRDGLGMDAIQDAILDFYGEETIIKYDVLTSVAKKSVRAKKYKKPQYPIPVYKEDIEKLEGIHNFNFQKIILSSIIFARSFGNRRTFSSDDRYLYHIISMAEVRLSVLSFAEKLSPLASKEEIFQTNMGRNGCYYILMYDAEVGDNKPIFHINNEEYMKIGSFYEKYIGGALGWCDICEEKFIKTGRNSSYCTVHSEEIRKERVRERVRKHRDE